MVIFLESLEGCYIKPSNLRMIALWANQDCLGASTSHSRLNAGDVLLWRRGAGMILFIADWRNQFVVVIDVLVPQPCDVPHALRFSLSGAKDAVYLDNLEQLRKPAWWLVEQSSALCLL